MSILSSIAGAGMSTISQGITAPINRALGYAVNSAFPLAVPPLEAAYDAFRRGDISQGALTILAGAIGVPTSGWAGVAGMGDGRLGAGQPMGALAGAWAGALDGRVQQVTMGDLIALRLRGHYTQAQFDERAKQMGWWRPSFRDEAWLIASNQVPGASDLVRFALRDAWDPTAVSRWGYDQDFPPDFAAWMAKIGWNGSADPAAPIGLGGPPTWAQMYWRAHWSTISPTQSYEMYQRLRPGRIARYAAAIPGIRAFTYGDLESQLKVNDYPPPIRPLLAAIAYRRPRLVDIDRWAKTGAIDRAEAYELHLDLGYAPPDAQRRTDWLFSSAQQITPIQQAKSLTGAVIALYEQGEISRSVALDRLTQYMTRGKWPDYARMLLAIGTDPDASAARMSVDSVVGSSDLRQQAAVAKVVTAAWKRQFLSGVKSVGQVVNDMLAAGRNSQWVNRQILTWQAILAGGRRLVSAARIKALNEKGIVTPAQSRDYLYNLGYRDPELTWLLRDLPNPPPAVPVAP